MCEPSPHLVKEPPPWKGMLSLRRVPRMLAWTNATRSSSPAHAIARLVPSMPLPLGLREILLRSGRNRAPTPSKAARHARSRELNRGGAPAGEEARVQRTLPKTYGSNMFNDAWWSVPAHVAPAVHVPGRARHHGRLVMPPNAERAGRGWLGCSTISRIRPGSPGPPPEPARDRRRASGFDHTLFIDPVISTSGQQHRQQSRSPGSSSSSTAATRRTGSPFEEAVVALNPAGRT